MVHSRMRRWKQPFKAVNRVWTGFKEFFSLSQRDDELCLEFCHKQDYVIQ